MRWCRESTTVWTMLVLKLSHVVLIAICFLPNFCFSDSANLNTWKFDSSITEKSFHDVECEATFRSIKYEEKKKLVDPIPILQGTWASQGCEIREGPQFIVRSLTFSRKTTFQFRIFHYNESSCTSPTFLITAEGDIDKLNKSKASSMQKNVSLTKLTIVGYKQNRFKQELKNSCPSLRGHFKINKEYSLLKVDHSSTHCHAIYDAVKSELSFLKTQVMMNNGRRLQELLTSYPEKDRSTVFEPFLSIPLISTDQRHTNKVVHKISRSTIHSPPIISDLPVLPILLVGEWISQRCETTGYGYFVMKRLSFGPIASSWNLKELIYSDPSCQNLVTTEIRVGIFEQGNASKVIDGAFDIDFLMPRTKRDLKNLWQGKHFEVKKRLSLVRIDINPELDPLLLIGELAEDGKRSTSFLPPLVQCSSFDP